MKKLTLKHAEAVSAAKLQMIKLADRETSPRFKLKVEELVDQLNDVFWWVLNSIYKPGLEFPESENNEQKPEPEKPKDDGTAARQD